MSAQEETKDVAVDEFAFDPSLKKKKKSKKTVAFDDEMTPETKADRDAANIAEAEEEAEAEAEDSTEAVEEKEADKEVDELTAMFGDLKKKKKSKKSAMPDFGDDSAPAAAAASEGGEAAAAEGDGDAFGELKKKKKSKKKVDLAAFEAELNEAGVSTPIDSADFGAGGASEDKDGGDEEGEEAWLKSDRDYTYPELLSRVFKTLRANNPDLAGGEKRRYTIVPPSVHREGNKKTIFANLADICKRMRRSPEHVIAFLFAELGTSGSVDGAARLIIKGRFQQKQLEQVLRRYIVEYVTCKTCKSPDTVLEKENRMFFTQCESCGSRRSVATIKSGFQAQVGRRKLQKA
ncbi:translation initiation factor eIF-2 beta subunit [Saitoella coloradoensis]